VINKPLEPHVHALLLDSPSTLMDNKIAIMLKKYIRGRCWSKWKMINIWTKLYLLLNRLKLLVVWRQIYQYCSTVGRVQGRVRV